MDFSKIIGQSHIKSHLTTTVEAGRIPHAQLFAGANGSGLLPMAMAYASQVLCLPYEKGSPEYLKCQDNVARLNHPDLHFVYPVNTNEDIKRKPVSDHFSNQWREFVLHNPYGSLFEWLQSLGIEKKQGNISVYEADNIAKKLALKSYEGGYKVMIIWMAENMNIECSNRILKLIEEPSERTVILLLAEREEKLLTTILSRCQKLEFPNLSETEIADALIANNGLTATQAIQISRRAQGDYNKALQLISEYNEDEIFEAWFISWVRTAFRAKGNKQAIHGLLDWSDELAKHGRETQKKFLSFCIEVFRQAFLKNYHADELLFFQAQDKSFSLEKFAPFIHQNNIFDIYAALEEATYHVERNANPKVLFTDLSIKLTRFIHKKQS